MLDKVDVADQLFRNFEPAAASTHMHACSSKIPKYNRVDRCLYYNNVIRELSAEGGLIDIVHVSSVTHTHTWSLVPLRARRCRITSKCTTTSYTTIKCLTQLTSPTNCFETLNRQLHQRKCTLAVPKSQNIK